MFKETINIIEKESPELADLIKEELKSQRSSLKMIASENYCSEAVRAAAGTILTDKYAEGYPFHRFYSGCDVIDKIEALGCKTACELFGADHANIQPSSGSDANLQAYWSILNAKFIVPKFEELQKAYEASPGKIIPKTLSDISREEWNFIRTYCHNQRLLALDYYSGGHLTHGYRQNISAQLFDVYTYKVEDDGLLDYDKLEKQAIEIKPLILLAGYSAYPRKIDFRRMREIADKCGAVLMVDMAHFAGLVAGKIFTEEFDPTPYADIVTTTTHKTLRGPRGGMILCKNWLAESVDKGCPLTMGGPLEHIIAAKTIALIEASKPEFKSYANQIVKNSKKLAEVLMENKIKIHTNGTENHIVMIDVSPLGLNGRQAEYALRECGITTNRNALPNDPNGPWYTSGIRLGTAALTTLGMKEAEMTEIANYITNVLTLSKPKELKDGSVSKNQTIIEDKFKEKILEKIEILLEKFRPYPEVE